MSIERGVRALFARLVNATLPRPADGAIGRAHRVLLLRHDAIGDMLASLGLIRTLAAHGLEVDVMASRENAAVLAENPWGVRVLVAPRGRHERREIARVLADRRYDAVIDGLVLKPSVNSRTVRLLRLSRAPIRLGTGGRRHDFLYTHPVATDLDANHHLVLAALLEPFGFAADAALEPVAMPLTDDERGRAEQWWVSQGAGTRVFVNISASSVERRWADERYVGVLRALKEEHPGLRVAISGGPADWAAAKEIAEATGGNALTVPLRDAFAVLAASWLVLTPDTSVAHAAGGFQVPSVVMTPQSNLRFAPWRAPARLVVAPSRGLDTIGEAEVLAALRDQLREVLRHHHQSTS
jgi:ADP-heptose:LPS heptosyltransferase